MPKYKAARRKRAFVTSESSSKVLEEVRQRYVNLFFEKYLRVYKTEDEAFSKVSTEYCNLSEGAHTLSNRYDE